MDLDQERLELKALELAYGNLHYSNISIEKTFGAVIGHLYEMYQIAGKEEYLYNALMHIWVFIHMGFDYGHYEEQMDNIFECLGLKKVIFLKEAIPSQKRIKLTRPQIRGMIGKWMPSSSNPKKIGEIVDEIIEKVKTQDEGIYTYSYKRGSIDYVYELVISPDQCFFRDVRQRKYYFFDLPEK